MLIEASELVQCQHCSTCHALLLCCYFYYHYCCISICVCCRQTA